MKVALDIILWSGAAAILHGGRVWVLSNSTHPSDMHDPSNKPPCVDGFPRFGWGLQSASRFLLLMDYLLLSGDIRLFALLVVDRLLLHRPISTCSMLRPPPPNQASECQQRRDPTD